MPDFITFTEFEYGPEGRPRRVTTIKELKPGIEIRFTTRPLRDYPNGFYCPWTIRPGPFPTRGYVYGTLHKAVVIATTEKNRVSVQITSGQQKYCKTWLPLARIWATTGERWPVPDPDDLTWTIEDIKRQTKQREKKERELLGEDPPMAIFNYDKITGGLKGGGGGMYCCPAHDDKIPSLHVTEKDGKVLFKCHTGCPQEEAQKWCRERTEASVRVVREAPQP
jgi:hypothetical protein